jgi:hypothetical protein
MSGFGMGTLNFRVYMALLTEGALSVKSSINIALLAEGKPITFRRHKKVGWLGAAAHLI